MSRSIDISYEEGATGLRRSIEIPPPYYLLGGQGSSMAFWSIPRIKEVGIERLAELGVTDPVYFFGWEQMALLHREITLLARHLKSIDYNVEMKSAWLSHLTYCYHLLVETAPTASTPVFGIG